MIFMEMFWKGITRHVRAISTWIWQWGVEEGQKSRIRVDIDQIRVYIDRIRVEIDKIRGEIDRSRIKIDRILYRWLILTGSESRLTRVGLI